MSKIGDPDLRPSPEQREWLRELKRYLGTAHSQMAGIVELIDAKQVDLNFEAGSPPHTPVTYMLRDPDTHQWNKRIGAAPVIEAVLKAGANPWLGQAGIDGKFLEAKIMGHTLITEMARVEKAEGPTLRGRDGENPLHLVAESPIFLHRLIMDHNSPLKPDINLEWLREPRHSDGATPLHLALRGWIERKLEEDCCDDEDMAELSWRVFVNKTPLDLLDHQGVSTCRLLCEAVNLGLVVDEDDKEKRAAFWKEVELVNGQECLNADTGPAQSKRMTPRL